MSYMQACFKAWVRHGAQAFGHLAALHEPICTACFVLYTCRRMSSLLIVLQRPYSSGILLCSEYAALVRVSV